MNHLIWHNYPKMESGLFKEKNKKQKKYKIKQKQSQSLKLNKVYKTENKISIIKNKDQEVTSRYQLTYWRRATP